MLRKSGGPSSFRRHLRLESLERRELLAGNVTAQVAGSTLIIRGNGEDNVVAVVQLASGKYAVAGLDTTVNGNDEPFITNNSVKHINANLGGGDDLLGFSNDAEAAYDLALNQFGIDVEAIVGIPAADVQAFIDANTADTEFNLPGSLTISMGAGNDGVAIIGKIGGSVVANLGSGENVLGLDGSTLASRASVGSVLSIIGGGQSDDIAIFEATVGSAAVLSLGNGENSVEVEGARFGSLSIITGKSDDLVHLESTDIRLTLTAVTGGGNDSVIAHDHGNDDVDVGLSAVINTGGGSDYVEFSGDVGGSLTVLTGDGADGVDVSTSTIGLMLTINTGNGNDNNTLDVGNADFTGTGGVFVGGVEVGYFAFIYLGGGNDSLDVAASRARRAMAFGGSGTDSIIVDAQTLDDLDSFFRTQFEDEMIG